MKRQSEHKETRAILVAVLFLLLGFLAVWLGKQFLILDGDAVLVTLVLVPIIAYLILSGRLTELKGPVGLEAKFISVAEQSVELASETIEPSIDDMQIVAKAGATELEEQIRRLDESKPVILTLTLGREGYYDRYIWLRYMEALSQYRTFKFVVILDNEGKFVAYIASWAAVQLLKKEELGHTFVHAINEGNAQEIQRYPGVITKTLSTKSTNVDALKEMTAQNVEALVVIDADWKLRGMVERGQLTSKLLLGIAK